MIAVKCVQGSAEWHWRRLGIPTASQFSRILTAKTMKLSSASEGYMHELLAEWLIGMPVGGGGSGFMERGNEMEPWAIAYYELQREVAVERVGFCLRDDGMAGASPDGLIGAEGGLEIKCPSAKVHVANLLDMTEDHFAQAQGGMWVTGRKWWDLLSYHPEMPAALVRIERDEAYIAALDAAVGGFLSKLRDSRLRLRAKGCTPAASLDPEFEASLPTAEVEPAEEEAA